MTVILYVRLFRLILYLLNFDERNKIMHLLCNILDNKYVKIFNFFDLAVKR